MNKRGVTLVELVIVFVIIAVLAVLMAPNIGAWLPGFRMRTATREVLSAFRTAQMRAVTNNTQYRVNFNTADVGAAIPPRYVLQRFDRAGGTFVNDGAVQTLPSGISIASNLLPNFRAVFNADSTSSGGSITLQNSRGAVTITVTTATGRANIS